MTQPVASHNPRRALNPPVWLACAVLLGLSACAQAPKAVDKKEAATLVFPLPPDDARFIYERTIRSSRDVDTSVAEITLEQLLTGAGSTATDIPLRKPYAIAVHQGRLFVSEPSARIVKVFDVPGNKYFTIGDEEPGALTMPIGFDMDGAGNLYVADITASAVMVYDRDGKFLRKLAGGKIGEPALFKRLTNVAVDKKGEKIYVVDTAGTSGTPEQHRVRVFDAKTGGHLFDIGKRGSEPGEFNLARGVILDHDNNLLVVDAGNFRVQVFDAGGKFLRAFGKLGQQIGDFARPKEIAVDATNNIYVSDAVFANFQIFTPEGELLMAIGSGGNDTPARYSMVSGIAVDEDGRVYVVDQQHRKIDIFRPAALGPQDGYLGRKKGKGEKSSPPAPDKEIPGEEAPMPGEEPTIPGDQPPVPASETPASKPPAAGEATGELLPE